MRVLWIRGLLRVNFCIIIYSGVHIIIALNYRALQTHGHPRKNHYFVDLISEVEDLLL